MPNEITQCYLSTCFLGFVSYSLRNKINYEICKQQLISNRHLSNLTEIKIYGRLKKPSEDASKLCIQMEKNFSDLHKPNFIPRTVSKHRTQLLPCKLCTILYLSKDMVANPHPRT